MANAPNTTKAAEGRGDDADRKPEGRAAEGHRGGEEARGQGREQGREQAREHGKDQGREHGKDQNGDEAQQSRQTERMTETGRAFADAGAESMRRGASIARDTTRQATETANGLMRNLSEQMSRIVDFSSPEAQRSLERASENLRVVARYGTVVAERAQPLMQEIVSYTSQATQAQVQALGRFQRARTPFDLIAAQGELMRTELELWVHSGRRIGELMAQMGEHVEQLVQEEEDRAKQQASHDDDRGGGRHGSRSGGRESGRDNDRESGRDGGGNGGGNGGRGASRQASHQPART